MSAMRFLLDENVDPLYRQELLRREPSLVVWKVGDVSAPPDSTDLILIWCEHSLLSWNNNKSMSPHLQNHLAQGRRS